MIEEQTFEDRAFDAVDEGAEKFIGRGAREVAVGPARDERGRPVRLMNHCAACGAVIFTGYKDFNGLRWVPEFFHGGRDVVCCPGCDAALSRESVLTMAEMDRAIAAAALCDGMMSAELFAAVNALVDRGDSFEDAAAFFGRSADVLRAEISEWMTTL